jgi:transcriptional/translational regulatory protein YebC/TACO1
LEFIVASVEEQTVLQEIADELKIPGTISLAYIPKDVVDVNKEQYDQNMSVIETFEDLEDVDTVYHNMNQQTNQ